MVTASYDRDFGLDVPTTPFLIVQAKGTTLLLTTFWPVTSNVPIHHRIDTWLVRESSVAKCRWLLFIHDLASGLHVCAKSSLSLHLPPLEPELSLPSLGCHLVESFALVWGRAGFQPKRLSLAREENGVHHFSEGRNAKTGTLGVHVPCHRIDQPPPRLKPRRRQRRPIQIIQAGNLDLAQARPLAWNNLCVVFTLVAVDPLKKV